jgi:hypothetical protein
MTMKQKDQVGLSTAPLTNAQQPLCLRSPSTCHALYHVLTAISLLLLRDLRAAESGANRRFPRNNAIKSSASQKGLNKMLTNLRMQIVGESAADKK